MTSKSVQLQDLIRENVETENNSPLFVSDTAATLRRSHPNLFLSLLVWAFFSLLVAGLLLSNREAALIPRSILQQPQSIPLEFWGVWFLVIGFLLTFGITSTAKRYRYARWAMVIGSYVGGFWAIGFWSVFFEMNSISVHPPLLWTIYTIQLIIWSREPTFNPISAVMNSKATRNDVEYRP